MAPFAEAIIDKSAIEFTGINVYDPDRKALLESSALKESFQTIKFETKKLAARAILVGHNAHFDLAFINAAVERCIK